MRTLVTFLCELRATFWALPLNLTDECFACWLRDTAGKRIKTANVLPQDFIIQKGARRCDVCLYVWLPVAVLPR